MEMYFNIKCRFYAKCDVEISTFNRIENTNEEMDKMKKTGTALSRYNDLIEDRKEKITRLKNIVNGKDKKYNYDIEFCKQELKAEKDLLIHLIEDEMFLDNIKKELKDTKEKYC